MNIRINEIYSTKYLHNQRQYIRANVRNNNVSHARNKLKTKLNKIITFLAYFTIAGILHIHIFTKGKISKCIDVLPYELIDRIMRGFER